jgi:alpha-tubulin suppressor-like RCC1 family protein
MLLVACPGFVTSVIGRVSRGAGRRWKCLSTHLRVSALLLGGSAISAGETLTADYTSDTMVPVTVSSYSAAGNDVNLSLSYAPTPGTDLMVVKNTGIGFISGEFANLAQGQTVSFSYGGASYTFVANYYGGSGNDLVLHWARQRIASWGLNAGRLGNGETSTPSSPVTVMESGVLAGKTVVAISSKVDHALALCSDGTLVAWGSNLKGQLGNGTLTFSSSPVAVDQTGVLAGKRVVAVSTGDRFSLVLCADGTAAAWGYDNVGQLGDGGTTDSAVPVLVDASGLLAGKTLVSIAAGSNHSVALCSDGTVAAWGSNSNGQLGIGNTTSSSVPVAVVTTSALAGKSVYSLSAGTNFTLGLCSDGKVVAWGLNNSGQLGNNATAPSSKPVAVTDTGTLLGKVVTSISAGGLHCLAGCADGTLVSWGANGSGQLGIGTRTDSRTPVDITGTGGLVRKTVIAVAAGAAHSLVLCADGAMAAWGGNSNSQLGINNSHDPFTTLPEIVRGGSVEGVFSHSIVAASLHSMALGGFPPNSTLSGLVLSAGSLAPAFTVKTTDYVTTVPTGTTSITLKPTTLNASAQIQVNGVTVLSGATSDGIPLAPGINSISVVVTAEDGTATRYIVRVMRSVDLNAVFQSDSDVPVVFPRYDATGLSATFSLGFAPAMGTSLKVIDNTGLAFITGQFTNLAQGQAVDLSYQGVTYHFVANYYGGTGNDLVLEWAKRGIVSWGSNLWGQLGNGSLGDSRVPVSVIRTGGLAGKCVVTVGAAEDFGIALCADGAVASWSDARGGGVPVLTQLSGAGAGTSVIAISSANRDCLALLSDGTLWMGPYGTFSQTAVDPGVLAGKSVVAISKGGQHCLALCSDGTIAAWGTNDAGQLGDGTNFSTTVPVAVKSASMYGKTVIAVSTGVTHSMALCSDGTLFTWGDNGEGQLGNNTTTNSNVPVLVSGMGVLRDKKVVALSQGAERHTVVLCSDGTVATWGLSSDGQLGRNTSIYKNRVPGPVITSGALLGKTVVSISSGWRHNIAVCSDGTIATWGYNGSGQLGTDVVPYPYNSGSPVKVVDTGELYGKKPLTGAGGMQSHVIMAEPDSGYLAWAADFTSIPDKRQSADPDGDGISNLMEYTLHGDPAVPSTTILPTVSADGVDFTFTFTRLTSSAADTEQVFEYSTDLVNWTGVIAISPTPGSGVALGSPDGGGSQSVTVTVPKGSTKQMFGRLQVKQP